MIVAEIADGTVDITPAVIRSPWLSVSDMLIANKCWLCMAPFQRGYKKKVFMVSQLALCLMQRRKEELACKVVSAEGSAEGSPEDSAEDSAEGSELGLPPIESKNFRACYEMFLQLDGDEANLTDDLKKHDVAEWLSGLFCTFLNYFLYYYHLNSLTCLHYPLSR